MIRRVVWVQLVAFVLISVVVAAYLAIAILRLPIINRPYEVSLMASDTGGLFTRSQVTYRGVEIGSVRKIELVPGNGVKITLALDKGTHVPKEGLLANISAFSAVGEQYVNLEPATAQGPFLEGGDVIGKVDLPPKPSEVLANADRFLASLDVKALSTVIDDLGATFDGLGPVLQQALDSTQRVTGTLQQTLPQTKGVINNGKTVLDGQLGQLGSIRSFSRDLNALSSQLVASDGDIRTLLTSGVGVTQQVAALLNDPTRSALAVLLGNLVSTNEILAVRTPAVRQLAVVLPDSLQALTRTIGAGSALPLDLQLVDGNRCDYGTPEIPHATTNKAKPPAPYLDKTCSGTGQRAADKAPRPAGDTTATPGNGNRQVRPLARAQTTGSYDPATRLATDVNGSVFSIGPTGAYGEASWTTLLLGGLSR